MTFEKKTDAIDKNVCAKKWNIWKNISNLRFFPRFCHEARKLLKNKQTKNPKVFLINPNGKTKYSCPMTYQQSQKVVILVIFIYYYLNFQWICKVEFIKGKITSTCHLYYVIFLRLLVLVTAQHFIQFIHDKILFCRW